jgi:YHS domain-containing protein
MNARLQGRIKSCCLSLTTCLSIGWGGAAMAPAAEATAPAKSSSAGGTSKSESRVAHIKAPVPATGGKIQQTAGWFSPRRGPAPSPGGPASGSSVQQELEELYRKNGREMPNMNLSEMEIEGAGRNAPPGRHAPNVNNGGGAPQIEPAKPNFFQRLFGRKTPQHNPVVRPPQHPQPQYPAAARPNAGMPASQFQPNRAVQSMPPGGHAPSPGLQQFPTPINPAHQSAARPQPSQPSAARLPAGTVGRPAQPSLELPNLDRNSNLLDDENLYDLDGQSPRTTQAPSISPNRAARRPAESQYSGLTITPGERETYAAPLSSRRPIDDDDAALDSNTRAPGRFLSLPEDEAPARPLPAGESGGPTLPFNRSLDSNDDLENLNLDEETTVRREPREALQIFLDEPPVQAATTQAPAQPAEMEPAMETESPVFPQRDRAPRSQPAPVASREKWLPVKNQPESEADDEGDVVVRRRAARAEFRGFRGFCPVTLRNERKLVQVDPKFSSEFRGRIYTFASQEAKDTFEESPERYLPVKSGADVVRLAAGEEEMEGSIEHAAWYRGRLYLFSSPSSREEFFAAPAQFVTQE